MVNRTITDMKLPNGKSYQEAVFECAEACCLARMVNNCKHNFRDKECQNCDLYMYHYIQGYDKMNPDVKYQVDTYVNLVMIQCRGDASVKACHYRSYIRQGRNRKIKWGIIAACLLLWFGQAAIGTLLADRRLNQTVLQQPTQAPQQTGAATRQVAATNAAIAQARPGDWIVRSNGQRVVLSQGDINYARQRVNMPITPTVPTAQLPARQASQGISQTELRRVLDLVARDMRTGVDVNNDGRIDCVDAAVLFYQHSRNRDAVRIIRNVNNATGMNHLYTSVLIDGRWTAIEPMARFRNWAGIYDMQSIWGRDYDPRFSREDTQVWRRFVR
ncbi:MAG: hypothetical protein FWG66_11255 [Spirochaetes bacterium]|nr:hypothetical protein [Spirochaetota bacterium]